MQLLVYILVYPILWFLSILPFKVLYALSDFISFILYTIVGYRKKVVLENLKMAYPEKSLNELLKIRREFYRHFVDIFMEMIKSITISENQMKKRFVFKNIDFIKSYENQKRSIILMGSHYANWEWMVYMGSLIQHTGTAVFTPIGNKYFEKMMLKSRTKYGAVFVKPKYARKFYEENEKKGLLTINALVSDQSPQLQKAKYWTNFLNVFVPVHTGAEELAKKLNQVVVFFEVKKVKRGYYTAEFKLLAENPRKLPEYAITTQFLKEVERQVNTAPEYYFWTHKRFKHKDKYEEWKELKS
ncbi:lysophospholipid acyltransferase family protein [Urechidicola croceus]|uniref:Lipid A biosynthesis acyltransferase n=1 Tax=Urechidicola croceus TaxID=1850246 RepID=A0A1D8P5R0_9FLAO|nr:lysophospholipid acyltransferase family protein [Urechidicola croceus]AOW19890.1 lipid A biosynthesis acyltransferase [Urechidicola croceus]